MQIFEASDSENPLPPGEDGTYRLQCWREYDLLDEEAHRLPPGLGRERPRPGPECLWQATVNFGDYVGHLDLDGTRFEVRSPKLDSTRFDQLLNDITFRVANLPFDFNSPTSLPFARISPDAKDVLYHALIYLRWVVRQAKPTLGETWAQIAADPHRRITREREVTPLQRATKVDSATVSHLFSDGSLWCDVTTNPRLAGTALAQKLNVSGRCYLPTHVRETVSRTTVDNPENQFLKYFITQCVGLLDCATAVLKDALAAGTFSVDQGLLDTAHELRREYGAMAGARFLSDVGEMRAFPANSQVLLRKDPYRQVLQHYSALVLASQYPISGRDLTRLLETKSASLLYEYWTFFVIADILAEHLGPQRDVRRFANTLSGPLGVSVREGLRFDYAGGVALWYNRSYSGASLGDGSYSVTLRPDITLQVDGRLHLFDAKFRVDRFVTQEDQTDRALDEADQADAEGTLPPGWFKKADIHKMHTYKDAIRCAAATGGTGVSTVWVLYPGSDFAFYDEAMGKLGTVPTDAANLSGVGAIPVSPGGTGSYLEPVIGALLRAET